MKSVSQPAPRLILASASPRRRYLLKQAGVSFTIVPSDLDEGNITTAADPAEHVRLLAEAKARDVAGRHPRSWVLGADTIVLSDGVILGKPGSIAEARAMLKRLSGRTHQVLTGYALCCLHEGRFFSESVQTDVRFKTLSDREIEWYIHTKEPFDKAGGYAIQGMGLFIVKSISGSYTNVVGLPVCEVVSFLMKEGLFELTIDIDDCRLTTDD